MIYFTLYFAFTSLFYSVFTTPDRPELPMSYIISPNLKLGFGFILSIYDSNDLIVDIIPCHNAATAEYLARYYKNS